MYALVKGPVSLVWTGGVIQLQAAPSTPLQQTSAYRAELTLVDAWSRPVPGVDLRVSAERAVTALVGSHAVTLGPAAVPVTTDSRGQVVLAFVADGLSTPSLTPVRQAPRPDGRRQHHLRGDRVLAVCVPGLPGLEGHPRWEGPSLRRHHPVGRLRRGPEGRWSTASRRRHRRHPLLRRIGASALGIWAFFDSISDAVTALDDGAPDKLLAWVDIFSPCLVALFTVPADSGGDKPGVPYVSYSDDVGDALVFDSWLLGVGTAAVTATGLYLHAGGKDDTRTGWKEAWDEATLYRGSSDLSVGGCSAVGAPA